MFKSRHIRYLEKNRIPLESARDQYEKLRRGTRYVRLVRPAVVGDGIHSFSSPRRDRLMKIFDEKGQDISVTRFVPASGAASRMFGFLIKTLNHLEKPAVPLKPKDRDNTRRFLKALGEHRLALEKPLEDAMAAGGQSLQKALAAGDHAAILNCLLTEKGLNYLRRPKALIPFHRYPESLKTAFEEQILSGLLVREGMNYHFTLPPGREDEFQAILKQMGEHSSSWGTVDFTVQDPSTRTIALTLNDDLFVEPGGHPLLRPGGHGTLIRNLQQVKDPMVFINNIDNVTRRSLQFLQSDTRKMLGGFLILLETGIHTYLSRLSAGSLNHEELEEIRLYAREELNVKVENGWENMSLDEKKKALWKVLDRPLRVCGMVKNEGEPGGGPFWISGDGGENLQIVEKAQIDTGDPDQADVLKASTHFNPVDMVCGISDFRGEKFQLSDYIDSSAYFVAHKTRNGVELKAFEYPGLWNGSMARWNTVFVEIPLRAFSPVKEVNDLLKEGHCPPS